MDIEIIHRPGMAACKVLLEANETLSAEAGAMISMSGNVDLKTTTFKRKKKGILKALKRMLAGESFFLNHFTPYQNPGEVILSAQLPGDMMTYELDNESLIVQASSYVCSEEHVNIDTNWGGLKNVFSGESFFWLNISGTGKTVFNSFGAIYPVEVDGEYIVDTGHIVAFTEGLKFKISKASKSWIGSFLGGEGLVCKFNGRGIVWCQSHNDKSFGSSLTPFLKKKKQ